MSTQFLTDQLRLMEEEIERLQDLPDRLGKGGLYRAAKKLLAIAKGLEAELTKAQADLLPHYAAIKAGDKLVDELSNERDALRADNEALNTFKLEAIKWLNALRCNAKVGRAGKSMADTALVALASLSK